MAVARCKTPETRPKTRRNNRGRVGTPEDIAGLTIFLSSRARAFTVGDVITCDGGSVASS
jgi:NAD(P)-dependent dehydrogenase (short-subunit alcohol dehydrogenase family)